MEKFPRYQNADINKPTKKREMATGIYDQSGLKEKLLEDEGGVALEEVAIEYLENKYLTTNGKRNLRGHLSEITESEKPFARIKREKKEGEEPKKPTSSLLNQQKKTTRTLELQDINIYLEETVKHISGRVDNVIAAIKVYKQQQKKEEIA